MDPLKEALVTLPSTMMVIIGDLEVERPIQSYELMDPLGLEPLNRYRAVPRLYHGERVEYDILARPHILTSGSR